RDSVALPTTVPLFPTMILPPPRSTLFPYTTLFRSLRNAAELSVKQLLAVRDDDRPIAPENLLGGSDGGHSLQAGILEGLETVEGNVQKVAVLAGNQRSHDVIAARDQCLQILLRIVALVDRQSDVLEVLGQHAVALDQFLGDASEGDRIGLVAGIDP